MTKKAFVVKVDRCAGCNACEMACKNEYQLEAAIRWRRVYPLPENGLGAPGRFFASLACNHCEDPACLTACPAKAYTKREDGIVVHHKERCIGCKMCMLACPYKVPVFNEKTKKVEKCHMCADKQDKGELPACVAACPMEALEIVDLEKTNVDKTRSSLPGFPDISITKPTTRFIKPNLGIQVRRDQ